MEFHQSKHFSAPMIEIENVLPDIGKNAIIGSLYKGLTDRPKRISSMFFYDATGSQLFKEIAQLPEYYPTRTEIKLLHRVFGRMGAAIQDMDIVEIGSGDCSKISILLDAIPKEHLKSVRYLPVDVSRPVIEESAAILVKKYPGLHVYGFVADFINQLHVIPKVRKRLLCFLGSTLGNLTPEQARDFFAKIGNMMQPDDIFLLGADRVKPVPILEKAYNDSQNVTARFNLNILNVVNNLTGANFGPDRFKHVAFYNTAFSRIEMHLEALEDMVVSSPRFPRDIRLVRGERIHTENSHKFTTEMLENLSLESGLHIKSSLSDEKHWFSLVQFNKVPSC